MRRSLLATAGPRANCSTQNCPGCGLIVGIVVLKTAIPTGFAEVWNCEGFRMRPS